LQKKLFLFCIIVLFGVSLSYSSDTTSLITQGDSLYHLFNNRGAEAKFIKALELEPQNADILWRLSRTMVDIGEHLPKDNQEGYYNSATSYADKAIAADAKNPQGHLRRAIALGRLALFKGVFKSVSLVKQVKLSLDNCLALAPNEPVAHYVLARTHHRLCEKPKLALKVMGLGWADLEIAEAEFKKAISLDETYIMFRYDYAKMLIELGRIKEAEEQLKKVLELPIRDEDDQEKKQDAKRMLSKK